ncbi:hypothetical protein ScPMuIL_013628 [Solemya velum]
MNLLPFSLLDRNRTVPEPKIMKVIILLATLTTALAAHVAYKDCGSVDAKINYVDINTCSSFPCHLPRNQNVSVVVNFTANKGITSATNKVYGIIAGLRIPFPVQPDACQDMTCSITSGQTVSYTNSIHVLPSYPTIRLVVEWEILDGSGQKIFCFQVPAQITN